MSCRNRFRGLLAAVGTLSALWSAGAWAAVPTTATVEGLLLSSGGGPAADGNYTVTFSIYGAETGGSAVWTEAGVTLPAKGGQFSYLLGSKTPLSASVVNLQTAYLGVQIGSDPELPRKPVGVSLFALRAAVAESLECSGCVKASMVDAGVLQAYAKTSDLAPYAKSTDLSAYAKTSDLSTYAKSSDLGAYAKTTDLGSYVKAASLATVAGTGSYTDLANTPKLAKVATSGAYADLSGVPAIPATNSLCGTGLFLKGFNVDGSINCVALKETDMPTDGINEISNGLIWDQFVDSTAGTANVKIPDGLGAGTTDSLVFPDIGVAQKVSVTMTIANSDLSGVRVELYGPGTSTPYVLYNGGKTGTTLTAAFNDTTAIVSGDLTGDWVGKNIKGNWSITVKDLKSGGGSGTPATDGTFSWAVNIQTLSSKKVQIKGNLIVDGNTTLGGSVQPGNDTAACGPSNQSALRYTAAKGLEACVGTAWVVALPKKVLFTGGCNHHGTTSGWNAYCLTDTFVASSTVADYFGVTDVANGVITVKVPGYYRMYGNWLSNACPNQDGGQLLINGARLGSTYSNPVSGIWTMNIMDVTLPLKAGDTVQTQFNTGGCSNYAFHQGSAAGTWSKFSMEYAGAL